MMNNVLKISLIVLVVLAAASGLFFAGSIFGAFFPGRAALSAPGVFPERLANPGDQSRQPNGQNDRGGMRQGPDGNMPGGPGGRMGQRDGGPDMRMGPGMGGGPANLTPVTADEAKKAAEDYIASLKIDGLEVGEVLIVDMRAYVAVKETATGNGAFELMVDPRDKVAHPAMGIASAWNLKYGGVLQANDGYMMGRMGHSQNPAGATATPAPGPAATPANVSADMPLSEADAIKAAQAFLDAHYVGATAATTSLKFYGYYSIDFSKDGKVVGKLSVNGYNGQVAGHVWLNAGN